MNCNTTHYRANSSSVPGDPTGFGSQQALGWSLADSLAPLGKIAHSFDQIDFLVKAILDAAKPGDHILVMSNGGFGGVHQKLLEALAQ